MTRSWSRWSDPCACSGGSDFSRRPDRDSVEIVTAQGRWSKARPDQGTGGHVRRRKAEIGDEAVRSGSLLARADGDVRAQESPGTSAVRSLDSGHFRRLHGRIGKGLTMRFGKWRGVPLALTLAAMLGWGLATSARADGWHLQYTIPREVPAYDFTTGGQYYCATGAVWPLREGRPRQGRGAISWHSRRLLGQDGWPLPSFGRWMWCGSWLRRRLGSRLQPRPQLRRRRKWRERLRLLCWAGIVPSR